MMTNKMWFMGEILKSTHFGDPDEADIIGAFAEKLCKEADVKPNLPVQIDLNNYRQ